MVSKPSSSHENIIVFENGWYLKGTGTNVEVHSADGTTQYTFSGTAITGPVNSLPTTMLNLLGNNNPPKLATNSQQTGNTGAPTTVSVTPPSSPSLYLILAYAEVTTATSIALKLKVTYNAPSGNSRADALIWDVEGSTTLVASVTTADRANTSWFILTDNSGTAFTIADNAGTYTTCAYNLGITVLQLV